MTTNNRGKSTLSFSQEQMMSAWEASKQEERYGRGTAVRGSAARTAKALGVSTDTANKWLKHYGITKPRPSYKTTIDQLRTLYVDQDLPLYECAQRLGLNEGTCSSWLKRAGVKIKASQERRSTEQNESVKVTISKTKLGEAYEIFSSKESLERFIQENNVRCIEGLVAKTGVSAFGVTTYLKRYDLWTQFDHQSSRYEREIKGWMDHNGIESERTRRVINPYEIDIYVPSRKFGIEFNGDYWHSEIHKDKTYHQTKSLTAQEAGVRLYHIFEHEWRDERKRGAVLSQIRNALDIDMATVYARKCEVREISSDAKRDFLNDYHVQGNDKSSVRYGLFLGDDLMSVMTFGKPRFTKTAEWEMVRFCTKGGFRVTGGASRLFSRFVKDHSPESVVSYADFSKTTGDLYPRLGFEFSHLSSPNYVWSDGSEVIKRYSTQMKDEITVMQDRGFYRIFDSGSKVFLWSHRL